MPKEKQEVVWIDGPKVKMACGALHFQIDHGGVPIGCV
jgi:hypothetical protein